LKAALGVWFQPNVEGIDRDTQAAILLFKEAAAKEEVRVPLGAPPPGAFLRQAACRPTLSYVD
jgi:hypothetical protein